MRSSCWGYNKNQIRVYFIALQAGYQRKLDHEEECLVSLQKAIIQQQQLFEQLQDEVKAAERHYQYLDAVGIQVEKIRIKLIRHARAKSRQIIATADIKRNSLQQVSDELSQQITGQYLDFIKPIHNSMVVVTENQSLRK